MILRAYFWLFAQELLLNMLIGPYVVGIKQADVRKGGLTTCKTSAFPSYYLSELGRGKILKSTFKDIH